MAGSNARRNKQLNAQILSNQIQVLKKVSTAAEPQGVSLTPPEVAVPRDPSANGTSTNGESLQRRNDTLHLQGSAIGQTQPEHLQQHTEGQGLQQVEELHEEPPVQQGEIRPDQETDRSSKAKYSLDLSSPPPKGSITVVEQRPKDGSPKPQQHIHVPSHMLAAGCDAICIQHQGTQQALLSPHSCSVAHRVAAALRAAAGERAAAAAARAAQAGEAAKTVPKKHAGQRKEASSFQTQSSAIGCRALRIAAGSSADSTREKQANPEQEELRPLPQNSCFPQVSCFSSNDEGASEITVRQQAEHCQAKAVSISSPEPSLISAAKLVGEMFSGAAAAAMAMASSAPGHRACDSAEQSFATIGDSCLVAGEGFPQATGTGDDKGGELHEGAVVLLGAVDRAVDAITSDEFKKQASSVNSSASQYSDRRLGSSMVRCHDRLKCAAGRHTAEPIDKCCSICGGGSQDLWRLNTETG